jgi:hypothetical protein
MKWKKSKEPGVFLITHFLRTGLDRFVIIHPYFESLLIYNFNEITGHSRGVMSVDRKSLLW